MSENRIYPESSPFSGVVARTVADSKPAWLVLKDAHEKAMRACIVGFLLFGFLESSALGQSAANLTAKQRLSWMADRTVGPVVLAGVLLKSGANTWTNDPHEYGPNWDGFGKRIGMVLSRTATSNIMEAGLGAVWGENPYYRHITDQPFKTRVTNVVKQTFLDKNERPAYARYISYTGSSFLSNTWRPDSQSNAHDASIRILGAFGAKMAGNAIREFWPDVKQHVLRRKKTP